MLVSVSEKTLKYLKFKLWIVEEKSLNILVLSLLWFLMEILTILNDRQDLLIIFYMLKENHDVVNDNVKEFQKHVRILTGLRSSY